MFSLLYSPSYLYYIFIVDAENTDHRQRLAQYGSLKVFHVKVIEKSIVILVKIHSLFSIKQFFDECKIMPTAS